jgi:HD-like signal output (HDOD) protein/ActR/RegA family two-component response regulator
MSAMSQVPPTSERRAIRRPRETQGILIVDDDELILRSLDRVLRRHAQVAGWDLHFVSNGAAALELLARSPISVALVDAQMPRMNGTALLRRIQESHPGVVRILMSGHTDLGRLRTALPLAHQFIPKPCDTQHLTSTLVNACGLRNILDSPELRSPLAGDDDLPAAPPIYVEINHALKSPFASADTIAEIVEKDIALSARVLLECLRFHGLPRQLSSVGDAAELLGVEVMKALVLSIELSRRFSTARVLADFSLDALQQRSAAAAQLAKRLLGPEPSDESVLIAGLLQDVGQLLFAERAAERFSLALASSSRENVPLYDAELELFGSTHAEVGGYLLGLWGLPPQVTYAVANHLQPVDGARELDAAAALYVANLLLQDPDVPALEAVPARTTAIDHKYLQALGVAHRLDEWRKIAREVADSSGLPARRAARVVRR